MSSIRSTVVGVVEYLTDRPVFNYWVPEHFEQLEGGTMATRARVLVVFMHLMALFVVPYAFISLMVDYDPVALFWMGVAIVPVLIGPPLMRWTGRIDLTAHLTCLLTLGVVVGNGLGSQLPPSAALIWLLVLPAYAAIFVDFRAVLFWMLAAVGAACFVYARLGYRVGVLGDHGTLYASFEFVASIVGAIVYITGLFIFQELLNDSLIERLQEVRRRLRDQTIYDDLTGLPNRALFRDRLGQAVRRVRRSKGPIAVGFFDLDDFKGVNDTLGHEAGDQLLAQVADRVGQRMRREDTVARLGGDEFVMIVEGADSEADIASIGRRVEECFDDPFDLTDTDVYMDASIGFARFGPADLPELDEAEVGEVLRRAADEAMYEAKEVRGTNWRVSTTARVLGAEDRLAIEQQLRQSLTDGGFLPYYQPIYRLADREIVAAEVLLRWEHPDRGVLTPGAFISVARRAALLHAIQLSMLERLRGQWDESAGGVGPLDLLVNVDPVQLQHPSALEELDDRLTHPESGELHFAFEITESGLLKGEVPASWLRAAGYELVVDDFGTGYSSLNRFREMEVDCLKLDMSFVQNFDQEVDRAIIRNVADLGDRLGVPVIGEGVETAEQLEFLRDVAGCDAGQGYHLGRPEPFEDFVDRLAGRTEPAGRLFEA